MCYKCDASDSDTILQFAGEFSVEYRSRGVLSLDTPDGGVLLFPENRVNYTMCDDGEHVVAPATTEDGNPVTVKFRLWRNAWEAWEIAKNAVEEAIERGEEEGRPLEENPYACYHLQMGYFDKAFVSCAIL